MLSHRRRALLTLASFGSFHYETNHYDSLYNSLVPNLLNSYYVDEKVKRAKISKIYANGVIENQKIDFDNADFNNQASSASTLTIDANSKTITQTCTASFSQNAKISVNNSIISGHKYLYVNSVLSTISFSVAMDNVLANGTTISDYSGSSITANKKSFIYVLATATATTIQTWCICRGSTTWAVGDYMVFGDIMCIDLTLMFGTGNEPTTLDDNRIKALLNRGYIEYNTGEYKSTDMGDIVGESYNLFDGILEIGGISNNGNDNTNAQVLRSKNWIKVQPNQSYKFDIVSSLRPSGVFVYGRTYKDDSSTGRFIQAITDQALTIPSDINYVRFSMPQGSTAVVPNTNEICVHNSLANYGYKPYKPNYQLANFSPIKIGSVQDSFVMVDSNFTFTKRIGVVNLGSLNWTYYENGIFYSTGLTTRSLNRIGCCDKYAYEEHNYSNWQNMSDKTFCLNDANVNVYVRDTSYSDASTFKSAMNGVMFYYELATPQTFTIPRRHLACVNLGTLNWNMSSGRFYTNDLQSSIALIPDRNTAGNIYCSNYKTVEANNNSSTDKAIIEETNGQIYIRDNYYTSAEDFKKAMAGVYIYYETTNEADENDVIDFDYKPMRVAIRYQGNGAINAHDTLEITDSEFVFTKNVASVDLGTLNWIQDGNNFRAQLSTIKTTATTIPVNAMCKNYVSVPVDASFVNYDFGCSTTRNLYFRNSNYSTASDFKSAMNGIMLYYELATPQVIRIPRKHLGVVDLGSLAYNNLGNGTFALTSNDLGKTTSNNICCSAYRTTDYDTLYSKSEDFIIARATNGSIWFYDKTKANLTSAEFKASMSGVLLFYETEDEVADIDESMQIEVGGTLTIPWHKNQQIENGNFVSDDGWTVGQRQDSISVSNGVGKLTIGNATENARFNCSEINTITNHKVLLCYKAKTSSAVNTGKTTFASDVIADNISYGTTFQQYAYIFTQTLSGENTLKLYCGGDVLGVDGTFELKDVMLIDLTKGFGKGNEPTSVNDQRVQDIIAEGYIDYNVNATIGNINIYVLPDIDVKFGVKD